MLDCGSRTLSAANLLKQAAVIFLVFMQEKTAKELRRQFVHALGAALVPLAFAFGKIPVGAASLILAFVIFILAEHRRGNSDAESNHNIGSIEKRGAGKGVKRSVPSNANIGSLSALNAIHNVFERFERSGGNYRGAFYFYLASAVSLFLFPLPAAMLSIAVLALGDSFSTAVGIFGRNRIFYNRKKTWEGTLAGFAAAYAGCFLISPQLALPAALSGMIAESLPLKIDDNLTVPILTGIALSVIAAVL